MKETDKPIFPRTQLFTPQAPQLNLTCHSYDQTHSLPLIFSLPLLLLLLKFHKISAPLIFSHLSATFYLLKTKNPKPFLISLSSFSTSIWEWPPHFQSTSRFLAPPSTSLSVSPESHATPHLSTIHGIQNRRTQIEGVVAYNGSVREANKGGKASILFSNQFYSHSLN